MPPHELQLTKESQGGRLEDILSHILKKVEGPDNILKETKEDVSNLS